MRTNLLSLLGIVICIVVVSRHPPAIEWTTAKIIGATIIAAALPLFLLARWQLGASFSVKAEAHTLVTTGLYARIRNPIYLFGGVMLAGLSLFFSPFGPLVVGAVLIPLQVSRARREEQVLTAAFGEEYERYKQGTWF